MAGSAFGFPYKVGGKYKPCSSHGTFYKYTIYEPAYEFIPY